jgi:hypothetical protein
MRPTDRVRYDAGLGIICLLCFRRPGWENVMASIEACIGGAPVKPTTPILDMATRAVRQGIVTSRFSITREQAAELKKIEADGGQPAGLQYVLRLLAKRG